MPSFNIVKESKPEQSFRVSSVVNAFDLDIEKIKEHFEGNIDIEGKDWNVGLIVGGSGTGKSTIAKEVFGEHYFLENEYKSQAVIDDMPKEKSVKDITKMFTSVGFASPPSWLKPYGVLSNGEKMRVDLANCLLKEQDIVVFDEFTSVVNREVAKTGSFAVQKAIRKLNKKFIAVACHSDIIEWLQPDWIYNTDERRFFFCAGEFKRPEITIDVFRVGNENKKRVWEIFRKYHYLNTELHQAAEQWVGMIGNELVCHRGIIQFPMRKGWKRGHRMVVLPDYQGIGIGTAFENYTSQVYADQGWNVNVTTSTPALVHSLARSPKWNLIRYGRSKSTYEDFNKYGKGITKMKNTKTAANSQKRITYSFNFK